MDLGELVLVAGYEVEVFWDGGCSGHFSRSVLVVCSDVFGVCFRKYGSMIREIDGWFLISQGWYSVSGAKRCQNEIG